MSFESVMPPYNSTDPTARFLSSSSLDFLLIEMVPMAYRVTNQLASSSSATSSPSTGSDPTIQSQIQEGKKEEQEREPPAASAAVVLDEEELRESVFFRLESIGYRVGQGLVERFSRDRTRFGDTLDVIKFLCKDLWTLVFRKQVDNLKTNHRGVYVLTDNQFRPFSRMSTEPGGQAVLRAQPFLWLPCGIVRGALAAMGIQATVQAETTELPGAVFQIKTIAGKN
ncbi:trafficking protein particle complex subunit 6B [Cladorrhinum samala]|uniref:Trafficking protein particle complex subunit 6B n=1 Tax=Cladorrhinum samala TaxID=585594 RepID=A0AAV9HB33_9PEZI|nr:trafficking protein particle complex subunit 6B [Cladorrhinum samala]